MEEITAEIITIGDEILYGQTTDTNSTWISSEFDNIGIKTVRKTTIGDIEDDILNSLKQAEQKADIIVITGGLGPTKDDLTKPCLAKYFNSEIKLNEEALSDVEDYLNKKGRELSDTNKKQAELPENCSKITNTLGTAPGMWFEENDKIFVSMPGVPQEMKKMVLDYVIPKLSDKFDTNIVYHKIIKTIGIPESSLSDKLNDWEGLIPSQISLAYLPEIAEVKLRLTAKGDDKKQLKKEVDEQISKLKEVIGKYIYGYNGDSIQKVAGDLLREKGYTIATAESCSGGYVAHLLTTIPGSSDYFMGGIVPYDNSAKIKLLDIDEEILESHGAVSEKTVIRMAENVRKKFNTDIGVSTTGIAGPSGGTSDKPVGTVWIAYSDKNGTKSRKLSLGDDRLANIEHSSRLVLDLIRQRLTEIG